MLINSNIGNGLTDKEVLDSRKNWGENKLNLSTVNPFRLLIRQISDNPLLLILLVATVVSFFIGQYISSIYVFWMILVSIFLGFFNEYSAEKTVANLLKKIDYQSTVIRNGQKTTIPVFELVVNDLVFVGSGNTIPADLIIQEAKNLEINEAVITGESWPVHKTQGELLMGTIVLSGSAYGKVTQVGQKTKFGQIAKDVSFVKPQTDFEKGLQKFGNLLVRVIVIMCVSMLVINVLLGKPFLEALLFALAIAVGLTPELLPVIVTISLSHGAGKMAKKHVIAKQLIAIENLGNMDILCTDKTGTLTEGKIILTETIPNLKNQYSENLTEYGLLCNSALVDKTITGNPLDKAIWESIKNRNDFVSKLKQIEKIFEKPFDFEHQKALVVVKKNNQQYLIVKGAPEEVLKDCEVSDQNKYLDEFKNYSKEGYRVIALSIKNLANQKSFYDWSDVNEMQFVGFFKFMDKPLNEAEKTIKQLEHLNVQLKILTGDNELVTQKVCAELNFKVTKILMGKEMEEMSKQQLLTIVPETNLFCRVTPQQKAQIISILKGLGHTVGFMGDGVNDLPALHCADVGISVNSAVDVAKDAANIVLLRKSLRVIHDGILEGRKTFSNTMKYLLMGTSSNFGNMFSAAVSSFILPFLPMTPVQILLNNSMYDIAQLTLPSDNVDSESLVKPRHWDINFIKNYMIFFGPISSLYDFLTYGLMFYYFKANASLFQTGWFVESLATQVLVVFVIRTSRPFYKSQPGKWLTLTCLLIVLIAVIIPFTPLSTSLGFTKLPLVYFIFLFLFVGTYLLMVEKLKSRFLLKYKI